MKVLGTLFGAVCLLVMPHLSHGTLVAYYPLDTDANDASGNGHHGTIAGGGITFGQAGATANTGLSADFTGAGAINVPHSAALNTPDFTVSLWVNTDSVAGYLSPITNRDDVPPAGTERHGWIAYIEPTGNWDSWTGGGTGANSAWNQANSTLPAVIGAWTHLAMTYDSATTTSTLYIDGAPAGSHMNGFSPNGTEPLHIGGGGDDGGSFRFDGRIDDVALYNTALDQTAIQDIMDNGVIPEPSTAGLLLIGAAVIGTIRRTPRA